MSRMSESDLAAYTARTGKAPHAPTGGPQTPRQERAGVEGPANKYGARKTVYNGRTYDSRLEADVAQALDLLKASGKVLNWRPQVPFGLYAGIKYVADFEVTYSDGTARIVDAKGVETPIFRLKRKLFEQDHGPLCIVKTLADLPHEGIAPLPQPPAERGEE